MIGELSVDFLKDDVCIQLTPFSSIALFTDTHSNLIAFRQNKMIDSGRTNRVIPHRPPLPLDIQSLLWLTVWKPDLYGA